MIQFNPFWVNVAIWLAWAAYWFAVARAVQATKSSEGVLMRMTHLIPLALGFFLIFHDPDYNIVYGPLYHNGAVSWLGDGITAAGLLFALWGRVHLGRYWSGIITLKEGHQLIRTAPLSLGATSALLRLPNGRLRQRRHGLDRRCFPRLRDHARRLHHQAPPRGSSAHHSIRR